MVRPLFCMDLVSGYHVRRLYTLTGLDNRSHWAVVDHGGGFLAPWQPAIGLIISKKDATLISWWKGGSDLRSDPSNTIDRP